MCALLLLVAGLLLAAGELASGDFWLLMLAGGALAASGAEAAAGPGAFLLDTAVFAVVSVALLAVARPLLKRRRAVPLLKTNADALEGRAAVVVSEVGPDRGLVRIGGQEWTARPFIPAEHFAVAEPVVVVKVDGATAWWSGGKLAACRLQRV